MKKQIKFLKSYFLFSREHRSGIFLLAILIVLLQFIYYGLKSGFFSFKAESKENQEWLLVQSKIDSLKKEVSQQENNLSFFNENSKENKLLKTVHDKIKKNKNELELLKKHKNKLLK